LGHYKYVQEAKNLLKAPGVLNAPGFLLGNGCHSSFTQNGTFSMTTAAAPIAGDACVSNQAVRAGSRDIVALKPAIDACDFPQAASGEHTDPKRFPIDVV
jgi:hypothetical protein